MSQAYEEFLNFLLNPSKEKFEEIKSNPFYDISIAQIKEFEKFTQEDNYTYNLMFNFIEELYSMELSGLKVNSSTLENAFLIIVDVEGLKNLLGYCYAIRQLCDEVNKSKLLHKNFSEYLNKINLLVEELNKQIQEYKSRCDNNENKTKFLLFTFALSLRNYLDDTVPSGFRFNKINDSIIITEEGSDKFTVVKIEDFKNIDEKIYNHIIQIPDNFGSCAISKNKLIMGERQPLYLLTEDMLKELH